MTGSPVVAAWIAHAAFFVLVLVGLREFGAARALVFAGLWLGGYLAASYFPQGAAFLIAYVALLDLVLVFMLFEGDVRIN